jgi:hypothetical protein
MTTISALQLSQSNDWQDQVQAFWVDPDSEKLNALQQDGATAVIDLATKFAEGTGTHNRELIAQVIGRLSDIQVRDFALGSHDSESADVYWLMWGHLIRIAPAGFVAPVACLVSALAYERGENETAFAALTRALDDDPKYALATLLRRVFRAGWPIEAFAAMRKELHPKVCQGIFLS